MNPLSATVPPKALTNPEIVIDCFPRLARLLALPLNGKHPAESGPQKSLGNSQKFIRQAMNNQGKELYEFGPFRLDPAKRILLRDNQPVSLQLKAFENLLVLVRPAKSRLKDDLMKRWADTFVEESEPLQNIFVEKTLRNSRGSSLSCHSGPRVPIR
jgi:DNA-binding response OmpR family regulator